MAEAVPSARIGHPGVADGSRYASWDLAHVHLVDERTGTVLCRLFPLDREKNADGKRRLLEPSGMGLQPPAEPAPVVPPLLQRLLNDYAATGLSPAYLPKEEKEEES